MNYSIIYKLQSKYSTYTCLIHLIDQIKDKTANDLYTGMVMLDLQKVYDTVDHSILCKKLKLIATDSIKWFESCLTNREKKVGINGIESNFKM